MGEKVSCDLISVIGGLTVDGGINWMVGGIGDVRYCAHHGHSDSRVVFSPRNLDRLSALPSMHGSGAFFFCSPGAPIMPGPGMVLGISRIVRGEVTLRGKQTAFIS